MAFALTDMTLRSPAFEAGAAIPRRFTGEGRDASPPLEWRNPPAGTRSFAIVCHDPDAPVLQQGRYGFVHWVLAGIPGSVRSLPEDVDGFTRGRNDFDEVGYGGPMPPEGHGPHHYFFWLLALDEDAMHPPGLSMEELLAEIEPHVVGMSRLVGIYERR